MAPAWFPKLDYLSKLKLPICSVANFESASELLGAQRDKCNNMKGRGKPLALPEPPGSWYGHKVAPGTKKEIFPATRPKTPARFKNRIRPHYSADNPFSSYDNRPEAGPDNQRTRRMNSSLNHRAVYETKNITHASEKSLVRESLVKDSFKPLAKTPLNPNFRRFSKVPKPITPAFDSRSVQLG